jgi:hypothetical protein
MAKNPTTLNAEDTQAMYWNGAVTRAEAQKALDEMSESIKILSAQAGAVAMAMQYLFWKLKIEKSEFDAFIKLRAADPQAERPKVDLN